MGEDSSQVPRYHQLMWPAIKALRAIGGSASNDELLAKVIELENIPEDIASIVHTDNRQTRINYNLAWAKTHLKWIGAAENSTRGVWSLTELGDRITEAEMAAEHSRIREEFRQRRREREEQEAVELEETEPELLSSEKWKDRLLAVVREIEPAAFERLSQRLLREAGFVKVEVTGRSGDGGIDGMGVLRVNLLSFQVLFQCKKYQGAVGAPDIRNFRGAMIGRSDKGLFITTGTFTAEARKEATRDGAPAIDLIDGDQLCDLLKKLKLGVRIELVEQPVIDEDWLRNI